MNFDKPDRLDILPQNGLTESPSSLVENLVIAFDVGKYNGGSGRNSKAFTLMDVWDPIIDLANENGGDFENPGVYLSGSVTRGSSPALYEKVTNDIYSWLSENKDTLPPELQNITPVEIDKRKEEFVKSKEAEMAELLRTSPGFLPATSRFVGSMGSSFFDPITVASLPFGGWSKSFGKQLLQNAAINAGTGAYTELDVKEWYDELGLEYGYDDFVRNVAMQTAFGAALPVGVAGIQLTAAQTKKGWEVLSGKGRKPASEEDEALAAVLDAQQETSDTNPLESPEDPNEAAFEHQSRLNKAQAAMENNMAPNMPNEPDTPVNPSVLSSTADNLDGVIFKFDPDEIEIDAKTFQFKSGGDEFGVTDRLLDTVWDKNLAGTITVYEYADGRIVISDGHQRLGLAKRIKAQDPSQEIVLYAYKEREIDGISPAESRVSSAIKNIANASKDSYDPVLAIDAAKVLREATNNPNIKLDVIDSLPPRSQVVKQAQDMMRLGDDAFMSIVNGVIPPNYASIVGRIIEDPDLQSAAVSVLAKSNPANAFEAEAIIRQVRESDTEQVKQIDLFGEKMVTESYFVERAKILDRAYKELRKDKAAFETLVRNSDRLEAEGNVLVKDANKRKADTDGQTIALLQTLANRKGPLSDALNEAARTARDTSSYVQATRGFLDAIRGSIESGDFERISSGELGRIVDDTPQVGRSEIEAEPALEGFDEPTGPAAEAQVDQMVLDTFRAMDEADQKKRDRFKRQLTNFEIATGQELTYPEFGRTLDEVEQPRVESPIKEEPEAGSIAELKRLLESQPAREQIDNHPAVIKALDDMSSRPETIDVSGYGSADWHANRVYRIDGEDVVGTEAALLRFEQDAEALAFKELKLDIEAASRNKEVTIVLGPPAAGKSTIANELAVANKSAILDSDEIKKALPEYEGGVGASAVHEESSELAQALQQLMILRGTNITLPKIGHTASSIRKAISLYKEQGYKVRLVNMNVTPENAYQRMIMRFVKTGRVIPPSYLDAVGANPTATYRTLKKEGAADGYAEIDNNGGFADPKEITELSGDNPLAGSRFDLPEGGRTGEGTVRRAESDLDELDPEVTDAELDLDIADDIKPEDFDMEIPVSSVFDEVKQENIAQTVTLRDLKGKIDQEDAMIARLEFCKI